MVVSELPAPEPVNDALEEGNAARRLERSEQGIRFGEGARSVVVETPRNRCEAKRGPTEVSRPEGVGVDREVGRSFRGNARGSARPCV